MAVLLSFPNVKQCMLVDRVTSGKNNQHQQEKFIPSLVCCQPFLFCFKNNDIEKNSIEIFHTHQRAENQNHFQLNAVFYDERWFLSQFHLSVVTLIDAIYINERCTMLPGSNSPSVHVKRREGESDIKKETNVCLSSWKSRLHVIRFDASAGQQIHWDAWPFLLLF